MISNIIERWGLKQINKYLENSDSFFSSMSDKWLVRTGIIFSFLIGFLTTFLVITFEIYVDTAKSNWLDPTILMKTLLINIVFITIEFYLLYQVGFKISAHYINVIKKHYMMDLSMIQSLCRAVLEVGEAKNNEFNIKPYRNRTKFQHFNTLIYSGKDIISSFLLKTVLRKFISRDTMRVFIPYIATIVTGFWDAFVQAKTITEIKHRIAARVYTMTLLEQLKQQAITDQYLLTLSRLVAVRLSYKQENDVTLCYLLSQLQAQYPLDISKIKQLESVEQLKKSMCTLTQSELKNLHQVANHLFYFRKKLTRCERRLLNEIGINVGIPNELINTLLILRRNPEITLDL